MKIKLLPLAFAVLLIAGCEIEPTPEKKSTLTFFSSSWEYVIVKIEDCEYIYMGHGQSQTIIHKGNCNNPIHDLHHSNP